VVEKTAPLKPLRSHFDPLRENLSEAWRYLRGDGFADPNEPEDRGALPSPSNAARTDHAEETAKRQTTTTTTTVARVARALGVTNEREEHVVTPETARASAAGAAGAVLDDALETFPISKPKADSVQRLARPSEAMRKTAIQKKHGGGFSDVRKAVSNVLNLLAREMKPLGVESFSTFDPLSGWMLYRECRRFAAARKRAVAELYRKDVDDEFGARGRGREETNTSDAGEEFRSRNPRFCALHPEKALESAFIDAALPDLKLGARHAAAAYGSLAAILENNTARDKAHGFVGAVRDAIVSGGDGDAVERRATEAAARSAKIAIADIVAADWVTLPFSPASYVAIDRKGARVVLAIRGTVSTGDLLTDAVSVSAPFLGGWAHSGMVMSAYQVCKTQLPAVAAALVHHPEYEFLVTGHSMGAGVAAILAMLIHSGDADVLAAAEKAAREEAAKLESTRAGDENRRLKNETETEKDVSSSSAKAMVAFRAVKCHCFAAPSVCSLDLSLRARAHTVSVVAGKDVIPRLCYAAVRRLLRRLHAAAPSQPVMRAISAALGGRDRRDEDETLLRGFGADRVDPTDPTDPTDPADRVDPADPGDRERRGSESSSNFASGFPSGSFADPAIRASVGTSRTPGREAEGRRTIPSPVDGNPMRGVARNDRTSGESRCQGAWDDVEGNRGLELRDHFASDFLVQPGRVIHLRHLTSAFGPTAETKHPTAFTEIPISTRMMADHVPMVYQSAIECVAERREREKRERRREEERFAEEVRRYGPGGLKAYVEARAALETLENERKAALRRKRRRRLKEIRETRRLFSMDSVDAEDVPRNRRSSEDASTSSASNAANGFSRNANDSSNVASEASDPVVPRGTRLWANARRALGGGGGGGGGGSSSESDVSSSSSGDCDETETEEPSSGATRRFDVDAKKKNVGDADDWSEDDEEGFLAVVAEMLGLDVSEPVPREESPKENEAPSSHRREKSWGLGGLGRLVGKLKRDADAMFTGEGWASTDETDAFEVDGYVAQAEAGTF